jgi:hypothetical protein
MGQSVPLIPYLQATRSMSTPNNASFPLNVGESEKYMIVAQLLRERARRPELPPEQVAKANSLAEYFETLADDPTSKMTIER